MIRFAACCLSALLVAACASETQNSRPQPASSGEPESLLSAEKAIAEAKALGSLWIDTETLLAQAQQEALAGRADSARTLADEARFQAETAIAQHDLARLKFARSNIDPKGLSESRLKSLLAADEKIEARRTQEALALLKTIDAHAVDSTPRFQASQNAYAPPLEDQPATAKHAEPPDYQLRRVSGRPGWRSTRIVPAPKSSREKP